MMFEIQGLRWNHRQKETSRIYSSPCQGRGDAPSSAKPARL